MPKLLPEGEEKLIAFPTGKRTRDGGPVYGLVKNTCFHVWHANRRAKTWGGSRCGAVTQVDSVHPGTVVGINVVVVRREKTVSSLSDAGSGATKSGDTGCSAVQSGALESVEAENGNVESNGSGSGATDVEDSATEDSISIGQLC